MSIKGIDTQIMISRLTDNSRDTSALQKRPEVIQDHLAAESKIHNAQDQSKVLKTSESEMGKIHEDAEGGSGAGYGGEPGQGQGEENTDEEISLGNLMPPENHIIDIRI